MKVAIIPARGGSKRVPGKNVRPFAGRPMMQWAVAAALQAGCFDRIIVSTDSEEVARIAVQCGAEAPFRRPAELAGDNSGTTPVVAHAIRWLREAGYSPNAICCIYATAAFILPEDLLRGLQLLESGGGDFAFAVTSYASPIQRALRINDGNRLEMLSPEHFHTRSQDLEPAYHDAGQFYWGRTNAWLDSRPIFSAGALPIVLPRHRVQDIDTPEDWHRAELMFQAQGLAKNWS